MTNELGPIFWQNTLPLMITILVGIGVAVTAGWMSNSNLSKRIDDTNSSLGGRLDEIIKRLGRIEDKLDNHGERITRLEERTPPLLIKGAK